MNENKEKMSEELEKDTCSADCGRAGEEPAEAPEGSSAEKASEADSSAEKAQTEAPESEASTAEAPEDEASTAEAPEGDSSEAGSAKGDASKKEEDEDLQTRYLRLSADFQNYRRRSENEKKDIYAYANEKIAVSLLDVLDNFERALQTGCSDEKFMSGMELIFKQMQDVLAKNNVEEIEALGKEFDPNFHNAVMTEASDQPSGTVTKVFQKGYMLNKKVIRPAMVAVAE